MKRIPLQFFSFKAFTIKTFWVLIAVLSFCVVQAQNVADYRLDKLGDNLFQVSLVPNVTYMGSDNRVSSAQVVVKVSTGGFTVANLTSLINNGQPDEVTFINPSRNNAPVLSPQFDYISFNLQPGILTTDIPFDTGIPVPLFTFQNGGICTGDSLYLIQTTDPFHFSNNLGVANTQHQLTVLGFGGPDAPVDRVGTNIADCTENCIVEFEVEKLVNGAFQVSMTPRETYTGVNRQISNMQISMRVASDGFEVGNVINLINTGLVNEVRFDETSRINNPGDNPGVDYFSFSMLNPNTGDIIFEANRKVPLFTFNNIGLCTEDTLRLITINDPFHSTNSINSNFNQQITVLGFGASDAPVCVENTGAEDCTRDCYLGCNDNVQVSLGINCEAEVLPEMVATALTLTCPNGPKGVEVLENGVVIPTSPFVNESHIGRTFQVRVIDSITTNSCWGSIIVKDKTAPVIFCQDDTVSCSIQDVSPDNPLLGYPMVIDYCSDTVPNVTFDDRYILNGCGTGFSGRLERTWSATDSAGMTGTCVQNIYFTRQDLTSVIFPPNRDGVEGPIVDCTDGATDPANTGSPTINGDAIYPNIVGVCQIDAGFRDETISFCEGNLQIIRTWTVVDGCTGDFRTDIQIISVQDTTPPILTCPDTIRQSVNAGTCSGTIIFPPATVSDACSGAEVIITTPFGTVNGNGGTLEWIPQGFHTVTYTAIDSCNNRISCDAVLHVEDRTPPVAACDFINDVALRPTGTVVVDATLFDDGSRDGCSGDQLTFLAQKVGDTLDFAETVTFYCTEAGDTINVNLRVTDLGGNIDECVAAIFISNDSPPQITCPANRTIQCTEDYSDLTVFGVPTIMDDCGGNTAYTEQDSFEINDCGTGRIIRTFSVTHGGNITSCQQIITVQNNTNFDGNTIVWPGDYAVAACSNTSIHPDSLPPGFNVPRYDSTGSLCSRILRRYSDAIFDDVLNPVDCYKVLRTWEIIDWCTFDANDTLAGGYWSYVQEIAYENNIVPTFTNCPTEMTIGVTDNSCAAAVDFTINATDDCTVDSELDYIFTIDLFNDGSTNVQGDTNVITGTYPVGEHRVLFTVNDGCGNINACNFILTIADSTAPTVVLNSNPFNIEDTGGGLFAIVDPTALTVNTTDDCTVYGDLIFTARPSQFSCSEEGLNQVTVIVEDEAGNKDSATVDVLITDTNNRCPINRTAVNISGIITNEMGERMEQVAVTINHPNVPTAMTNEFGEFSLEEVPVGNDYTILPARDHDVMNGISTFDLVLISRHILNVEPITSPYRMIAADVNRSGSITAFDLVQLRKLILRINTEFPNNRAWRFVRSDFTFKEDPNQEHFPEVYNINDLPKKDMQIEGFIAIKVGDVNASATTSSSFSEGESRNATTNLELSISEQYLREGTTIEIPVSAKDYDQLLGYQFAISFDPSRLSFLAVLPNEERKITDTNFGFNFIEKGIITTSWEQPDIDKEQEQNPNLFTLKFLVKSNTKLSQVLTLDYDFMKAEAYQKSGKTVALLDVALTFDTKDHPKGFTLYQNKPNPFKQTAIIAFDLPAPEKVKLTILDLTGRVVRQFPFQAALGYNELVISNKNLDGKGVYYYQLETSKGILTKKMILIE